MKQSRRVLVTTAVVFALAVLSRNLVFAIPGYRPLIASLPEALQWLEQPVRWTLLCLVGLYLGMTIYSEGVDSVLGNVFGSSPSDDSEAGPRVPITEAVSARVSQDLEAGAARRGYSD